MPHINVASFRYMPYQWFDEVGDNVPITGFKGVIFTTICQVLNVSYTLRDGGAWGHLINGTWSGVTGMTASGEADIALAPVNPDAEKMKVVHLSSVTNVVEIVLVNGRMSKFERSMFSIVMAFNISTWLLLFISIISVAIIISVINFLKAHAKTSKLPAKSFISTVTDTTFTVFQSTLAESFEDRTDTLSLRILWATWLLAVSIVLMNKFTGQLQASLTIRTETQKIETMMDLFRKKEMSIYLPKNSVVDTQLKVSDRKHVNALYKRMIDRRTGVSGSTLFSEDNLQLVLRTKACMMASRAAASVTDKMCSNMMRGEFYISTELLYSFGSVMLYSKTMDSKLRTSINTRLEWLRDSGILLKWYSEMKGDWNGCSGRDVDYRNSMLGLKDLQGIFFIYLLACLFTILAFVIEYVARLRDRYRQKSVPDV